MRQFVRLFVIRVIHFLPPDYGGVRTIYSSKPTKLDTEKSKYIIVMSILQMNVCYNSRIGPSVGLAYFRKHTEYLK